MLAARSVEDQARLEREQQVKFSAAYHTYSDPDVLSKMTRAQVQALEPVIGRTYADHLLNKWESISKHEGALTEARMDKDAFNSIALDYGIDPYKAPNKMTVNERARLGAMRDAVERQIGIEQKAKNRQLTRDEKDDVARRVFSTTIMRSKWFGLSSDEVPIASITPADLGKVVVPPSDRDAIKAELTKRGKPATDAEIAKWYLQGQRLRPKASRPRSDDIGDRALSAADQALLTVLEPVAYGVFGAYKAAEYVLKPLSRASYPDEAIKHDEGAGLGAFVRDNLNAVETMPVPSSLIVSPRAREIISEQLTPEVKRGRNGKDLTDQEVAKLYAAYVAKQERDARLAAEQAP
jgi:hypothetical protein